MYGLEHRGTSRMNIAAGGHAEPALQRRREIGEDVTEHVAGHDHIERARLAHHLQAERVHIHVLSCDAGKLLRDLLENALP